ncbi:uncharacterized protein PAC_01396 [Phialocephala subalpina]|uniref:Extracellular membrane protein CFEM domain-containing protein n=1 Tax=Phialocephala subalpina TaxID=576137 RepID=A0A1L7WFK5_9HELO|nr:uncharacterized protein PAC_01396 [Phialocephala subalpina]
MRLFCLELFLGLVFIEDVFAIVYVTDLPVFSALAPCAQGAVQYEVGRLTQSECGPAVTALESCVCTQDQNSAAVSSSISSQILFTCGKTASDDVSSASVVLSAYCNQGSPITTAPPGSNAVTQYITDLSAFSDLAPCASGGLQYLIMGMTNSVCPTGGPSALASCVCSKNQNSLAASEAINSEIKFTCGSTHTEDITSAQAVLAGYCGLANGTTSFPTPTYLPGDVTYYITALPQYQSLASCAQQAIKTVQVQTYSDCPSNPQALVSCLCVKDSNSLMMTSKISGAASLYCGSTASANMASALSLFDFYCSVGKGLATVTQKLSSVATTAYGSGSGSKATSTGKYSNGGATSTSTGDGGTSSTTNTNTGPNPLGTTKSGVPVAAIAGAVGGAVVFICFLLFVGWRYRRRRMQNKPLPPMITGGNPGGRPDWSKAELPNTETKAISPKSLLLRKPVPMSPVSPIDDRPNPLASPQRRPAEMAVPPAPLRAEVPSGPNAQELHHDAPQHEVHGSNQFPVEMGANLRGPFEMDGDRNWR